MPETSGLVKKKRRIAVRPAVLEDAHAMWETDQACFEPSVAYPEDIFYYHLLILHDPAFVAYEGNSMAGFVLTSLENGATGLIVTIDVMPRWRRQGLASSLMQKAEDAMRLKDISSIILQVAVDNDAALGFYKKRGYYRIKQLVDYYGKGRHAYLFKKPLAKKQAAGI